MNKSLELGAKSLEQENAEKLEKSLLSMRAKLEKIVDIALAADAKCGTCDRIELNWITCSNALCEIRDLCGPSLAEKADPAAEAPQSRTKDAAMRGEVRAAKTPMTVVFNTKIDDNRELSAEINSETTDHRTAAYLFDGLHVVCKIEFFDQYQGRHWAYPIVRRALNGLMSKAGKAARHRKQAAKRAAAAKGVK